MGERLDGPDCYEITEIWVERSSDHGPVYRLEEVAIPKPKPIGIYREDASQTEIAKKPSGIKRSRQREG